MWAMARPRKGSELGASSTIALRLPADLRGKVEALAERHGRSLSDEVRAALEGYVASGSSARDKKRG